MRRKDPRGGFSMVEVLLVCVIMIIFGTIALVSLTGRRGRTELDSTAQQITALLREAQNRSMTQVSSSVWGVYFHNSTSVIPYYALFAGTYSTSSRIGLYRLPTSVQYATSSLAQGATRTVTFSQITGLASASTSIGLQLLTRSNLEATIRVASSGAVGF